jgi:phosphate transport system ATP-binding protein
MGMSAPEPVDDQKPVAATSTVGDEPAEQTRKIETSGLNLYYGAVHAVRDVDFWATSGDITAIIGPSGCGKSTLLRSLNRINDVIPGFRMEGSILLDGEDLTGPGVDIINLRRRMGMLFQRPNPFPASIYDNVAYGLRLAGRVPRSVSDGIVESSLKRVALWDEVSDRLGSSGLGLSGGQQQRLCLARALAVEPEVILMDEPCSALDPIATLRIEELLHELRGSVTMVIVTHNMQQATRVSDRTAFMLVGEGRTGELVEMAPTVELFSNPRDRRTEDYITGRFG